MLKAFGNIWDHIDEYDAVVITTNGYVKKNGEAVMGRGIALEAKNKYTSLSADLGKMLTKYGNNVFGFKYDKLWILTMPVKPEFGKNGEPGWRVKADLSLIQESVKQLAGLSPYYGVVNNINTDSEEKVRKILMPRPGCGNGGLTWTQVRPIIEPILDDRFTVMTYAPQS